MKRTIIVAVIAAAIAIPVFAYAASPLFINTRIDEAPPVTPVGDRGKGDNGIVVDKPTKFTPQAEGKFTGVGDGIHDAQGIARILPVNEMTVLRLEEFRSTNGPDLYVYLSTDTDASEFVSLGKLKANNGNQNYEIPGGTDISKYDTVLIWCQQFSVLFGSAELVPT